MIPFEEFDSLDEFRAVINNRPNVPGFDGRSSDDGSYDFTKTHSLKEADEIMRKGYKEGLENLFGGKGVRNLAYRGQAKRSLPHSGIIGYAPIVPNALRGLPNSMIASQLVPMKAKVITIDLDIDVNCGVKTADIISAGRSVLRMIDKLEKEGHRVNLNILSAIMTSNGGDNGYGYRIKLKDARHPIDPLKIAYPIIHPSMLRRHVFRWLEGFPKITKTDAERLQYGYGYPLVNRGYERARDVLIKNKSIDTKTEFYCTIATSKDKEPDELISFLGIK